MAWYVLCCLRRATRERRLGKLFSVLYMTEMLSALSSWVHEWPSWPRPEYIFPISSSSLFISFSEVR